MADWVFVTALVSNVFCAAVNLYTWRVAYPLWRFAGERFAAVHAEYMRRLDVVITIPHVLMFFAAAALVWVRPSWFGAGPAWWVFGLDTAVIVVSAGLAGPVHTRFTRDGLDEAGLDRLVWVSAWRSVMMAASCGVLVWGLRIGLR